MRVVFTDFAQPDLDLEQRLLVEAGLEAVAARPPCASAADVIDAGAGAAALIAQSAPVTREVFAALPDLRIVAVPQIGVDTIDLAAAAEHGVWIANVPDASLGEVVTHTLAMALSLVRRLAAYDRSVREGGWDYAAAGPLPRPASLTYGVAGMGRIGRLVATRAAPFFGDVLGFDPYLAADAWPAGIDRAASLSSLMRSSDVVSLHLPLTDATRHLVDRALLAEMKPGSLLVNVARGAIVDLDAVTAALDDGRLAGAALDVLADEPPPPDHPALRHPKLLLSPHAAFYSVESERETRARAVANVVACLRDGRPHDVVVAGTR